jgi:replicative DNA helicase
MDNLYSPTTEESIIGSLIVNPDGLHDLRLSPDDFYIRRWGMVFEAMLRHEKPDMVTICVELDKRGQLEEVGGSAELTRLSNSAMFNSYVRDLEQYAAIIREKATRRRLVAQAQALAMAANNQERPLDEAVSAILAEIAANASSGKGAQHWSAYLEQADAEIEARRAAPLKIWGLPTGFADFDYITGGLQLSELLLLAAAPGVGKSIFVMQLATQLAEGGHPGAYYSLEMTGRAVARRALSAASGVQARVLKSGNGWTEDGYTAYYAGLEALASLPVYMADDTGWTTNRLQSDLARLKRTHGIKWFVVDYSFMLTDGDGKLNEIEKTALVISRLKSICKALDLTGAVIHSMNKGGMSSDGAELSGLRGSGQVTYDTDLALFMSIPDPQNQGYIRLTFGKGRELENPRGYFDLVRLPGLPKYQAAQAYQLNDKKGKAK